MKGEKKRKKIVSFLKNKVQKDVGLKPKSPVPGSAGGAPVSGPAH